MKRLFVFLWFRLAEELPTSWFLQFSVFPLVAGNYIVHFFFQQDGVCKSFKNLFSKRFYFLLRAHLLASYAVFNVVQTPSFIMVQVSISHYHHHYLTPYSQLLHGLAAVSSISSPAGMISRLRMIPQQACYPGHYVIQASMISRPVC